MSQAMIVPAGSPGKPVSGGIERQRVTDDLLPGVRRSKAAERW